MNTRSLLVLLPLLVIVALTAGGSVAFADVYSYNGANYTIPAGYQSYQGGIFYNPNTGVYLNPVTGVTSNTPLPSVGTNMYVVPQGFVQYNYDTFYNPSTGMYFNRLTGQTTMYSPNNPATYNPDGTLKVAPGYTYYSNGVYYNPTTNSYWSTTNGTYSPTVPSNPPSYVFPAIGYTQPVQVYTQPAPTYTVAQAIPALPKTGTGGDAAATITVLLASLALMIVGVRFATQRA